MENPIQYCNTDNPSQMGGLATRGGLWQKPIIMMNPPGLIITGKLLWYAPLGHTAMGGGVNENFTAVHSPTMCDKKLVIS